MKKKFYLCAALLAAAFLLVVSCSGVLSESRRGTITLRFNTDSSIRAASAGRSLAESDTSWTKAVFSIVQDDKTVLKTVENTGSADIVFTHTAAVGAKIRITVDIYQPFEGIDKVFYRGESEPFTVAAGNNPVSIKAVSRLAEVKVTVSLPSSDVNWIKTDFVFLLENDNEVTKTLQRVLSDDVIMPVLSYMVPVGTRIRGINVNVFESIPASPTESRITHSGESGNFTVSEGVNEIKINADSKYVSMRIVAGIQEGEEIAAPVWQKAKLFINGEKVAEIQNTDPDLELPDLPAFTWLFLNGVEYTVSVELYNHLGEYPELVCEWKGEKTFTADAAGEVRVPVENVLKLIDTTFEVPSASGAAIKDVAVSINMNGNQYTTMRYELLPGRTNIEFDFYAPSGAELKLDTVVYEEKEFADGYVHVVPVYFEKITYTVNDSDDNSITLETESEAPSLVLVPSVYIKLRLFDSVTFDNSSLDPRIELFDPNGRLPGTFPPSEEPGSKHTFCFRRRDFDTLITLRTLGITEDKFEPAAARLSAAYNGSNTSWYFGSEFKKDDGSLIDVCVIDVH